METLHIIKSEPDSVTNDFIRMISGDEAQCIHVNSEATDWHDVVQKILDHEKIICWW